MINHTPEMIDIVFDLEGGTIPAAYPFALWEALVRRVPPLAEDALVGILPLRGTENSEGFMLPKRAKLIMRLPVSLTEAAARLTGQQLDISGSSIRLGAGKTRAIQPHPTIHAQLVTGDSDEVIFIQQINTKLGEMKIKGNLICGKRRNISNAQQTIHGYSLVVHDLKPEDSIHLQSAGLGTGRQFGCGIFVPSKIIAGLGEN